VLFAVGSTCIWFVREQWIAGRIADADYLLFSYCGQLAVVLLFVPVCVARLRDLSWSPYLALIVLVPALTDIKLFVWLAHQNGGTFPTPAALVYAAPLIVGVYLVLLLFLFLRRSASAEVASSTEGAP
jgi:uncharacterized membrane protein YhaH (DUF805 family)